jgi:deoxyribodipyrimidine photo-lyase
MQYSLVWFRRDLRILDNLALSQALLDKKPVIGLYIIDKAFHEAHKMAACQYEFILAGVAALQKELTLLNIPLLIVNKKPEEDLTKTFLLCMEKLDCDHLYFNKEYEWHEKTRDEALAKFLKAKGKNVYAFHDLLLLPPRTILTQEGNFYKVFTAFKRAFYGAIQSHPIAVFDRPKPQAAIPSLPLESVKLRAQENSLFPAGEKEAERRLQYFLKYHLKSYHQTRDFPALNATSQLSPYIARGMISLRHCFVSAMQYLPNTGAETWMNELIWREFYLQLLIATPRLSKHKAYQINTEKIQWENDLKKFEAWKAGQTGFPIIDAAMRCLQETGFMHNRLRMITAMFLTKNLWIDWRWGEAYFISQLIDGDLAANNGGWQWCASTGTDAAPYFRVFNPITQSQRFDAEGSFIRRYCPELSQLNNKAIHAPPAGTKNYPSPIVDLSLSRKRAIEAFKSLG